MLTKLNSISTHPNHPDLFKRQLGPILKQYRHSCSDWTPGCHQASIFVSLMLESGTAVGFFAESALVIYQKVLKKDSMPEIQLKMLLTLSQQLLNAKESLDSQGQFGQFAQTVVKGKL